MAWATVPPRTEAWQGERGAVPERGVDPPLGRLESGGLSANQLGLLSGTQIAEQHGQRCLVDHFMFEQVLRQRLEFIAMHFEDLASPLVHALNQRLRFIINASGGVLTVVPGILVTTI